MTSRALVAPLAITLATIGILVAMGRRWWCACGSPNPVSLDVWSSHNSQHLLDAYSGSHFQHGLVFYGLIWLALRGRRPALSLALAVGLEAAWEVLENTPLVIERYRAATASLDYTGDSVANSVSDLATCGIGWLVASRLPVIATIAIYLGIEIAMLIGIRDSLILNVVMLLWPMEAIKSWQMAP